MGCLKTNGWPRGLLSSSHLLWYTQPFNDPLSGTTRVSWYQKGKTNLDLTEARDSEWQWHQLGHIQACILIQSDIHTSTPPLSFLQAWCHSCRPTNSVKALKENCDKCVQEINLGNQHEMSAYRVTETRTQPYTALCPGLTTSAVIRRNIHPLTTWKFFIVLLAWRSLSIIVNLYSTLPSVLWHCWLGDRKGIRPVKTERWGAGVVICLERGGDLHMAQLMPLPLTSVKSRLVLPSGTSSPG